MASRVIEWDGRNLPDEMRELPPGWYVVAPVDDPKGLTPEEEAGLEQALDQLEAGDVLSHEEVMRRLRDRYRER